MCNLRSRLVKILPQIQNHRLDKCFIHNSFYNPKKKSEIMGEMPDMEEFNKKKEKVLKDSKHISVEMRPFGMEPLLSRKQEFHLFRQLNYLKFKLNKDLKGIRPKLNNFKINSIEINLNNLITLKQHIIRCNTRLAVSVAKKIQGACEFWELISDGMFGLLVALDHFDYRKGFKFGTYAFYVLRDKMLKGTNSALKCGEFHPNNLEDGFLEKAPDYRGQEQEVGQYSVAELVRVLPRREKAVVTGYYKDGQTLDVLGKKFGISRERVRQIKDKGLKRLELFYNDEQGVFKTAL